MNAVGDVLGFTAYASAARHDLAVAAVVASEYAVVDRRARRRPAGRAAAPAPVGGIGVALAGIAIVAAATRRTS